MRSREKVKKHCNGICWIAEWLGSECKISIKNASAGLQRVSPKISKRVQIWLECLEVFIFANNSFLRLNIVNPSVETEFQMYYTLLIAASSMELNTTTIM